MDRSRGAGASPPRKRYTHAGNAGVEPMVTKRVRAVPLGFILCLLAVLISGTSIEPRQAIARTVTTGGPDGNPYTGDPTGDDVPSPTPKPTALKSAKAVAPTTGRSAIRRSYRSFNRWSIYLSILTRLGIR